MGTKQVRCPTCNKFGSRSLGGYCKVCQPKEKSDKHINQEMYFGYGFHKGSFIKDDYGYKKYGYQR